MNNKSATLLNRNDNNNSQVNDLEVANVGSFTASTQNPTLRKNKLSPEFEQQRKHQLQIGKKKLKYSPNRSSKFGNRTMDKSNDSSSEYSNKQVSLPSFYCVNIGRDGTRTMDLPSHINPAELGATDDGNLSLMSQVECKLRPISGVRNYLKRNNSAQLNTRDRDVIRDTDLMERLILLRHSLKRLDLSHNNLRSYPVQLCSLHLLESLNLSGNLLTEADFPAEIEHLQNLSELILDGNSLKHIPKCFTRCKKLTRLSISENSLVDLKNLESLKRLKTLVLDSNSLTQLDDSIRNLEKLEYFYASNNSIQTIQFNVFKSSLNSLRQLDLSSNKLQIISTELFMLPNLEWLNLSNNSIGKLPAVQSSHIRAVPIYSLDLSGNHLSKFYEYVLYLALNVDMSGNRLKILPKKSISKLTENEVLSRVLKLDQNPLIDPPLEVCVYGLKSIQEYFEDESRQIQLNKGFKIVLLGDCKSGKTSLSYALEDFHTKSNLIEQYQTGNAADLEPNSESKLVEIHEFYMNSSEDNDEMVDRVEAMRKTPAMEERRESRLNFARVLSGDVNRRTSVSKSARSKKTKVSEELNAFSNSRLKKMFNEDEIVTAPPAAVKKQILPVTIYEFNGSLPQYSHIMDTILDKNALVIICVDASSINHDKLTDLLDTMFLKMSKNTSFKILPVLTKSDLVPNSAQLKQSCDKIEHLIAENVNKKLVEIRGELNKIESLSQINASQSDRLKQLAQTQSNLNPDVHGQCLSVSSVRMVGIEQLAGVIREIVMGPKSRKKMFADVNTKVPVFWSEVENYACNKLAEMPSTKSMSETGKIKWSQPQNMNMFCVDFSEFKEKVVEKYGMSHLIEQITKYMSASGRILWYQDSERLKRKVFLRPSLFYDMLFVLYRSRFYENFTDAHLHALRLKLVRDSVDTSETYIRTLCERLLNKGHAHIDLLKLIWFPILIIDSTLLLKKISLVFMDFFYLAYPVVTKEKLKTLMTNYSSSHSRSKKDQINQEIENILNQINEIVVPFYLPLVNDVDSDTTSGMVEKTRLKLKHEWSQAVHKAVAWNLKKSIPKQVPRIVQKFTFQWGLMPGVFEKFSVNCLFNSELYYVSHYKNFIHAYNEDNTIGIIIHTDLNEPGSKCTQVTFEFYLVSYQQILESLQESSKTSHRDDNFEQTLSMDLDQVWVLALRVLHLFEETITSSFPNLRYDRWSQCPECGSFSFMGEWLTPKVLKREELQKHRNKICTSCEKTIDCSFLVKPSSGRNLALDMKKIHQRLENIARMHEARLQMNSTHNPNVNSTSQPKSDSKTTLSMSDINNNNKN